MFAAQFSPTFIGNCFKVTWKINLNYNIIWSILELIMCFMASVCFIYKFQDSELNKVARDAINDVNNEGRSALSLVSCRLHIYLVHIDR